MKTKIKYHAAFAVVALASSALQASAQRVWDGETDGVWTDATNWDGNATIPSGTGTNLNFGLATNYTITARPNQDWGTWSFLSTAGAGYNIAASGNGRANIVVEGSTNAANHTIVNQLRVDGRSINVQSTATSLTLNNIDYGGATNTFTKNGVGTLIVTNNGNSPGNIALNAGIIDIRGGAGSGGLLRLNGTDSAAILTNSTGATQTLRFAATNTSASSFAGSVTGNLNLENGRATFNSGVDQTFTSTSASTYTGTTTLHTGSFTVNGTHNGGGNYVVGSRTDAAGGGTLGGSGTVVLSVSTNTFNLTGNAADRLAVLRPGATGADTTAMTLGSTGINTTVNLNNFSVMRLDVGAGGNSDRLAVFGGLNIDSGSTLDLLGLGGAFDGSSYTLATFTGTRTGTFGTVTGLQNGYGIVYGANSITAVIPEPSAALMLLGGMGLVVMRRRR